MPIVIINFFLFFLFVFFILFVSVIIDASYVLRGEEVNDDKRLTEICYKYCLNEFVVCHYPMLSVFDSGQKFLRYVLCKDLYSIIRCNKKFGVRLVGCV